MKRLWVCALLLVGCVSLCLCARVGLRRTADGECRLLQAAEQTVKTGDDAAIDDALLACEAYWKSHSRPFYLFIDHNFFNQYEYTLFHLRDYAALDRGLALERIGYCAAVLEDLSESQKPVFENIF